MRNVDWFAVVAWIVILGVCAGFLWLLLEGLHRLGIA